MEWTSWALLPILVVFLWLSTAQLTDRIPKLRGKSICLLIAHPDDEAMFFAPTVLALTKPALGNHVKILCLSSGNAEGLGETRKKELAKSGLMLGLRGEDDVLVIDDPNFPDSMTTTWDSRLLGDLLLSTFAPSLAKTPNTSAPPATIDVLITFDKGGVSSHPNHISLLHGARAFMKALMHRHKGWDCPVTLYTLTSTNIVRKYLGLFDAPITLLSSVVATRSKKSASNVPYRLFFTNGLSEYWAARRAMTTAHQSQMLWFRWFWIVLSRYMTVNDLKADTG
ncbi:LmbE-like protein [Viridothelium virens]|uniref:N-acetylglucosaminylphosphatidylinositol deacetylase n=1 Tax=Viridothelium virens TaxID=1048519 RepID=A0A6A6HLE4_VIRVR|nr:LmbE-like protein [Viridothelium virens]